MDVKEQLIEEVRSRPILYDLGQQDYTNVKQKEISCSEVADALKIAEIEYKRWKGLRDSYKRCKIAMEVAFESDAERDKSLQFIFVVFFSTIGNLACGLTVKNIIETVDDSSDDFVSPKNAGKNFCLQNSDSLKFQQFLDFASSSISETSALVTKQKEDSTTVFFAGLAAKFKAANMPPSVVNKIEAKLSAIVCDQIDAFYSQQQQ